MSDYSSGRTPDPPLPSERPEPDPDYANRRFRNHPHVTAQLDGTFNVEGDDGALKHICPGATGGFVVHPVDSEETDGPGFDTATAAIISALGSQGPGG